MSFCNYRIFVNFFIYLFWFTFLENYIRIYISIHIYYYTYIIVLEYTFTLEGAWQPTPVFLPGESPWTEEPGRLQSLGSQRVGHDRVTEHTYTHTHSKGKNYLLSVEIFSCACMYTHAQWHTNLQLSSQYLRKDTVYSLLWENLPLSLKRQW